MLGASNSEAQILILILTDPPHYPYHLPADRSLSVGLETLIMLTALCGLLSWSVDVLRSLFWGRLPFVCSS